MKMYKLITGFYPSRETAEKVLKRVKGNCHKARIEPYEDSFTVVLVESDNYEEIDSYFSQYMNKKIYCGILLNGKTNDIIGK